MRLVDIDDIRVMKFPPEEDDPSESDGEREYRNGWNDAIDAINDIQPSAEPDTTVDIDRLKEQNEELKATISYLQEKLTRNEGMIDGLKFALRCGANKRSREDED